MALNLNHFNLQEHRRYPLDDAATGTDDDGLQIDDRVIADLRLRMPNTMGNYAFVGGITVTAQLASVVILGAVSPTSTTAFSPLAAITILKPVPGKVYQLRQLVDGVSGWIVFGAGVDTPSVVRFSSPAQSLVTPRCARPYRLLPVPSLGKAARKTALTGLITIKGGNDVEVVKETVLFEGITKEAMVIRLIQDPGKQNVLKQYLGPCDVRPESGTCNKPGIEKINDVPPDCAGNINIRVAGATPGSYGSCGGLGLELDTGLDQVCAATNQEFVDLCTPSDSSLSSVSSASLISSVSSVSTSSESIACQDFPFCTSFDNESSTGFIVHEGSFLFEGFEAPEESCTSIGSSAVSYSAVAGYSRNLAILETCNMSSSLQKVCEAAVQITADNPRRNGGLIINYHTVDPLTNPHVEYFMVLIDLNVNKIRVVRFNGYVLVEEYASPNPLPLMPDAWYTLRVTVQPFGDQVAFAVHLVGQDDDAALDVGFSMVTNKFGLDDGMYGVGSDKGHARFSYFQLAGA